MLGETQRRRKGFSISELLRNSSFLDVWVRIGLPLPAVIKRSRQLYDERVFSTTSGRHTPPPMYGTGAGYARLRDQRSGAHQWAKLRHQLLRLLQPLDPREDEVSSFGE